MNSCANSKAFFFVQKLIALRTKKTMSIFSLDDNLLGLIICRLNCHDCLSLKLTHRFFANIRKYLCIRQPYVYDLDKMIKLNHSACKKDYCTKNTQLPDELKELMNSANQLSIERIDETDCVYTTLDYFCQQQCLTDTELRKCKIKTISQLIINSLTKKILSHQHCLKQLIQVYFEYIDTMYLSDYAIMNHICHFITDDEILQQCVTLSQSNADIDLGAVGTYLMYTLVAYGIKVKMPLDVEVIIDIDHHFAFQMFGHCILHGHMMIVVGSSISDVSLIKKILSKITTDNKKNIWFSTDVIKRIFALPYSQFVEVHEILNISRYCPFMMCIYHLRNVIDADQKIEFYKQKNNFSLKAFQNFMLITDLSFENKQKYIVKVLKAIKHGQIESAYIKFMVLDVFASNEFLQAYFYHWNYEISALTKIFNHIYAISKIYLRLCLMQMSTIISNISLPFVYSLFCQEMMLPRNRHLLSTLDEMDMYTVMSNNKKMCIC